MKTKTKKILSRVGAALLLGMSLFNFGAAWRKSGQDETFKRAKQVRKKEKEELKPDTKAVMEIAEQEAGSVMKEVQRQTTVKELEESQKTISIQTVLKYGVVGTWVITAGLFFSSMIFNYPLALGKGVLTLLPGVPHLATLSLDAENRFISSDQVVSIKLKLDTNKETTNAFKARILYNPEMLEFLKYEPDEMFGEYSLSNPEYGVLDLQMAMGEEKETDFRNMTVAELFFLSNAEEGSTEIKLLQDKSWVYKFFDKSTPKNILGKIENISIRLILPENTRAFCHKIDFDPVADSRENWQAFGMGTLLPGEETKWTYINSELALACGYNDQKAFFLVSTGKNQTLGNLSILDDAKETILSRIENISTWSSESNNFIVIPVAKNEIESRNVEIVFNLENAEPVHWPKQGTAGFEFKQ